jgi:hypothetical protein
MFSTWCPKRGIVRTRINVNGLVQRRFVLCGVVLGGGELSKAPGCAG